MKTNATTRQILQRKGNNVWSVTPDTLVYRALQMMQEKEIGAMVVISEAGDLEGIISERDYARKVILEGRSSRETATADIMTRELHSVSPNATADECISLMLRNRIRHLPVLEGGKLVGLVSIGDVVKAIVKEQRNTIEHLDNYISGKYV
jgi:CBS domain-containing protein